MTLIVFVFNKCLCLNDLHTIENELILLFDVFILRFLNLFFILLQLEPAYKKAHAAIRADPSHQKTKKPAPATAKRWNKAKLTLEQRKQYVSERKATFLAKLKSEADA